MSKSKPVSVKFVLSAKARLTYFLGATDILYREDKNGIAIKPVNRLYTNDKSTRLNIYETYSSFTLKSYTARNYDCYVVKEIGDGWLLFVKENNITINEKIYVRSYALSRASSIKEKISNRYVASFNKNASVKHFEDFSYFEITKSKSEGILVKMTKRKTKTNSKITKKKNNTARLFFGPGIMEEKKYYRISPTSKKGTLKIIEDTKENIKADKSTVAYCTVSSL